MRGEAAYQTKLVSRIETILPGAFIQQNDPRQCQGIPDLLILWNGRWAMLEVKVSADAPSRPNQPYYIDKFNEMSFASFIYPEIEEQVLHELQSAFGAVG